MKVFFTRVINVLLVVIVLLVYQQHATARSQQVSAYNAELEEYEKATQMQAVTGYKDGTYTGTAAGFGGDLTVEVTVKDTKVTKVEVKDNSEDEEYLKKASALLDKIVENQGTDGLDVVSGATFSSNGILDAFNDAMKNVESAEATDSATASKEYKDGTYTGTAAGFGGDLTVAVTVKDKKISKVEVKDNSEDEEYLKKASALLDTIVENQGTDGLDVVSGATFSSNGILDAFNNAMEG